MANIFEIKFSPKKNQQKILQVDTKDFDQNRKTLFSTPLSVLSAINNSKLTGSNFRSTLNSLSLGKLPTKAKNTPEKQIHLNNYSSHQHFPQLNPSNRTESAMENFNTQNKSQIPLKSLSYLSNYKKTSQLQEISSMIQPSSDKIIQEPKITINEKSTAKSCVFPSNELKLQQNQNELDSSLNQDSQENDSSLCFFDENDISQHDIHFQYHQKNNLPQLQPSRCSTKQYNKVFSFAANTNQGLVRDYNEDRMSIIINPKNPNGLTPINSNFNKGVNDIQFYGLYDGHGGNSCADFLKDNLHHLIFQQLMSTQDPKEAIRRGFSEAERKFMEICQKTQEVERSGACAIVVIIIEDQCYVANVGDSRAILSSQNGRKVYSLSQDHKPSDEQEAERIFKAGGKIYQSKLRASQIGNSYAGAEEEIVLGPHRILPGKLSVSRAFGDFYAKLLRLGGNPYVLISDPDIISFKLKDEHDFIFLGCDGIYDRNSNEEIVKMVWNIGKNNELENIHTFTQFCVETIIKESMAKKSYDNLSGIMISLQDISRFTQNSKQKQKLSPQFFLNKSKQPKFNFNEQSQFGSMNKNNMKSVRKDKLKVNVEQTHENRFKIQYQSFSKYSKDRTRFQTPTNRQQLSPTKNPLLAY